MVNAWNKSSVSLKKMEKLNKKSEEKSGLGFYSLEHF